MMFLIRQAIERDAESICLLDRLTRTDRRRKDFIERSVAQGECFVIAANGERSLIAYGVLEYSFYSYGFISMLYVDANHRQQNYGGALVSHMEAICKTEKIFTSTNLSNVAMQSLLAKLGYKLSGVIHNLDEDDPELVYCKVLLHGAV
jgi:ribosomal protein S18 acetylase RimI-like enzyme